MNNLLGGAMTRRAVLGLAIAIGFGAACILYLLREPISDFILLERQSTPQSTTKVSPSETHVRVPMGALGRSSLDHGLRMC